MMMMMMMPRSSPLPSKLSTPPPPMVPLLLLLLAAAASAALLSPPPSVYSDNPGGRQRRQQRRPMPPAPLQAPSSQRTTPPAGSARISNASSGSGSRAGSSPLFVLSAVALPREQQLAGDGLADVPMNPSGAAAAAAAIREAHERAAAERRRKAEAATGGAAKGEAGAESATGGIDDSPSSASATLASSPSTSESDFGPPDVDAMRARAGVLRTSILRQQMELQELERQVLCCSRPSYPITVLSSLLEQQKPLQSTVQSLGRSLATLSSSTDVLLRKLGRVHTKQGPTNQQWDSVGDFVTHQSRTAGRIVKSLVVDNPTRLQHLIDPETPTLVPHVPAILARLDRLEHHVEPILERVLNNRRHLASVEPYLDEILERFDDIEPHLPWILDNVDALAPYTGLLLKHIDELLLYAEADEYELSEGEERYDLAEQLLPYLEYYVSKLDVVGPHLPLLRPHVPLLLKHDRIGKVSPYVDKLFARGYTDLSASANMDVLLFWFGWTLRIPFVPRLFFSLPWGPRIVSFLANRLPKRFCRGACSGVSCCVDDNYGSRWNKLEKA